MALSCCYDGRPAVSATKPVGPSRELAMGQNRPHAGPFGGGGGRFAVMLAALGICFLSALGLALGRRWCSRLSPWWVSIPSLLVFGAVLGVPQGAAFRWPWLPELGVEFGLRADGLGRLFALLIAGIGVLIQVYAAGYFQGKASRERLLALLLLFEGAMLGLAYSEHLLTLFAFWELTSVASFLLIGFDHGQEKARKSALQALTVTSAGGLALFAGLLLLGWIGGTYELTALARDSGEIVSHPAIGWAVALILLGCLTKSAQFPFHFWLPGAMAAPTPVSAYLHSATMVKAGVFLAARLTPVLGEAPLWTPALVVLGSATVVAGGVAALLQSDLKLVLAYSTVHALGALMVLVGVGTPNALHAAIALMCSHALYKGALFTIVGCVDKQAGTRALSELGGLARRMPWSAAAAGLASLSLIGGVAFAGFTSKELAFKSVLEQPQTQGLVAVLLVAALSGGAVALLLGYEVFWGRAERLFEDVREAPPPMLVGPLILSVAGVALPLASGFWENSLIQPALRSVTSAPSSKPVQLWYGFDLVLGLSVLSWLSAWAVYRRHEALVRLGRALSFLPSGTQVYELFWKGTLGGADLLTRRWQNGRLRWYAVVTVASVMAAPGLQFSWAPGLPSAGGTAVRAFEALPVVSVVAAALYAAATRTTFAAVAALGVVGWGLAAIYVDFGAPDLALTQLVVEALTVVLFVFVVQRIPSAKPHRDPWRLAHAVFATLVGLAVAGLAYAVTQTTPHSKISDWHAANSLAEGFGRNVVNVILVDFRALDTLGEIAVLAVAAIGVVAMYRTKVRKGVEP
ncbi:MAG: proton-conducting transporter membrane subunit [Fimbriimonadales bacterium]|nr:proton-conducting transporter membrane subunit [Fimbriimonadales bacterium]